MRAPNYLHNLFVYKLLTYSKICYTLQVKIKRYVKTSGPPNRGSVYISLSNLLTSSRISSTLQVKVKRYVKTSSPLNGRSVYISVVTHLLTSSRISSILRVKIKIYVTTSGPPEWRLVVHPHSSHWMHGHRPIPYAKGALSWTPHSDTNHQVKSHGTHKLIIFEVQEHELHSEMCSLGTRLNAYLLKR